MALKITQVKGLVGTKPNHRANIEALGLKRIGHSVIQKDTRSSVVWPTRYVTWSPSKKWQGSR